MIIDHRCGYSFSLLPQTGPKIRKCIERRIKELLFFVLPLKPGHLVALFVLSQFISTFTCFRKTSLRTLLSYMGRSLGKGSHWMSSLNCHNKNRLLS